MRSMLWGLTRRDSADAETSAVASSRLAGQGADTPDSATALASTGCYAAALVRIDVALAGKPDDTGWVFARGWTLFEWARFHEARTWLQKAAALGLEHPLLFVRAGWTCIWTTGAQSGEPWMRRAIECTPDDWLPHFGLGSSLLGQGRIDEAAECFERALARSPENARCLWQLFHCRYEQGKLVDAEAVVRRAIDAEPANPTNWTALGIALIAQDRSREAIEVFKRAKSIAENEGEADPHLNLAICLRETGRLTDALTLYERALPARPSVGAHAHYGHALLAAGRLAEGWTHYEFRWMQDPLLSLRLPLLKPVWGGQDLRGKTILLRCEQGVGDVIQFIRYAPRVKALGATVLLQLRKNIRELAETFPGIDRILSVGEAFPDFDYYIHLMSLPRVFGTDLASIPADVPYLHAEKTRIDRWAKRLRDEVNLKVGLVWAGDPGHLRDRYRSIPLTDLVPLLDVPGVQFFCLQKGPQAEQIAAIPSRVSVVDVGPEIRDFADTAAIVSQLDMVICVDTSVGHLAAALGKPVWMLVPTPSDWRWLEWRDDSPWYPTMRLFRQLRQGDWEEVVDRVTRALRAEAEQRRVPRGHSKSSETFPTPRPLIAFPSDEPPRTLKDGFSAVAETRAGIVQYWPDRDPVGRSIERYGEYLQIELEMIGRWIVPGATIVEVGADIGMHALMLASALGPTGHLLLYEDDPLVRQVLQQNLRANRAGNVTLMKRRLRDVADSAATDANGVSSDESIGVETIDDLRLETLQWLKVNYAALGTAVLAGAADTLWRLRPKLFLAASGSQGVRTLAAKAMDLGYRCFRMETPLFNPNNFNQRLVDVFEGRTATALLAIPEETSIDVAFNRCFEL